MKRLIITVAVLGIIALNSCQEKTDRDNTAPQETVKTENEDIVTITSTDKEGNKLDITYNNIKGTATLNFKGVTIELEAQKAASGIWYKNDTYELRGKGNNLELQKDGQTVFIHQDNIVNVVSNDQKGNTLNLTFNNTEGTVKAHLNGGEQIDLKQEKAASGIWYKNENYELRGKGDSYLLVKNGVTVFQN
ncbi:MliC family protein [Dokdonia genika]|uniref:MliC family protein n=1 Tax=Dokdonia genika TaxID=308113 RepID=A0ABV9L753_9FLAO